MDTKSQKQRSSNMRAVRSKDTLPELAVRRLVHRMGYRYRIHRRDLPGKPDLVFGPRKKVIFVHGCFWHSHRDQKCKRSGKPKSNTAYWGPKLARNRERDLENQARLADLGWDVLIIWECETRREDEVKERLIEFLG